MTKILTSPGKYIQGRGVLGELGKYVKELGQKILVIEDPVVRDIMKDKIESGLENLAAVEEEFNGECSPGEIDRLGDRAEKENVDMIAGIGGGKTLDTAKAVSHYRDLPVIIIPTIAATDAPCSALSVIYTAEGVFKEYLFLTSNPDLVMVDTEVIAGAPVRYIVSGMGDALATYFEAEAAAKTKAPNMSGGSQTITALTLAELSFDILLEYGPAAVKSVEAGVVSPALEKIVEANTLLSGLGFESGGLAAAHAIHNGLTVLEETHTCTHGEKVAFATIVQIVLEDRPVELINGVINFCHEVGLPTSLYDLGLEDYTVEDILKVARSSCAEEETIHNMPFTVEPGMVKDAILMANELGK